MASKKSSTNEKVFSTLATDDISASECAICMDKFIYPCKLPCGHVFCFLCIKGTSIQSSKCALCRADIPSDYVNTPQLIKLDNVESPSLNLLEASRNSRSKKHVWYYEGRNGWWQYDYRTNLEIENEYRNDKKNNFQLLIGGSLYTIDLEQKIQARVDDPNKKRRIKRDLRDINSKKGVAGILLLNNNDITNEVNMISSGIKHSKISSDSK